MDSTIQAKISLRTGAEAYSALDDDNFRKKWQALYLQCSWATPFQDYRFVSTWYRIYKDCFEPVILCEAASDGSLVGLLALANPKESGQLVVAGAHQAEYQVWLSTPERSTSFIEKALQKLHAMYLGRSLTFRYLPPLTPMDWAAKRSEGPYCEVERRGRPLLVLNDGQKLAESLRKKSNKSRLNRLSRLGNVEFEEIKTSADLSQIFDQIIAYYDLRQGAIHDSIPFNDDLFKKTFYLALMEIQDFLHVTVLKVGKDPIAAHIGLRDKNKVYLGVFAHSPFLAQHSPGKLHLLMLGEKLADENYSVFDLTPGDDPWKERFATDHEEVYIVTAHFNHARLMNHRLRKQMKATAKYGLRLLGVSPHSARSFLKKLRTKLLALKRTQKMGDRRDVRLYMFKCKDIAQLARLTFLMKKNYIPDLLAFQPSGPSQTRKDFLTSCLTRLEEGCHVYTLVESGLLLHSGWLAPQQPEAFLPKVDQTCSYLPRSAGLFDFYTHPKADDQGLYKSSLCRMLLDAAALPGTEQIYVAVWADDDQARQTIERVGIGFSVHPFRKMKPL